MANDEKAPVFSEHKREQLLLQRILVLDGVLDDDNGTLLAAQLLALAAEAREYGFIDAIVGSFGQVMPARKHRVGLAALS